MYQCAYQALTWKLKDKDLTKAVEDIREQCSRLKQYKQNFVWSAAPLFHIDGSYITGETTFDLYKIKGSVHDLVEEINSKEKGKRTIPGSCVVDVVAPATDFGNRLTTSFAPIKPFDAALPERTKEAQEFTSTNEHPYPYVAYVNNYYFYLQRLDVTGATHARNVAIEVKFMEDDADPNAPGMPIIYGDSTSDTMRDSYTSAVWYHDTKPHMLDEIAIKLPTKVTEKHHLLLKYTHINCKPPKKPGNVGEGNELIGYSVVKLLHDHQ